MDEELPEEDPATTAARLQERTERLASIYEEKRRRRQGPYRHDDDPRRLPEERLPYKE